MRQIEGKTVLYFFVLIFVALAACAWIDYESKKPWDGGFVETVISRVKSPIEIIEQEDGSKLVRNIEEGFEVVIATSADEGLKFAKELRPAAITLDVIMPQKDGWSVLRELKADPEVADIPVVMLTIVDDKNLVAVFLEVYVGEKGFKLFVDEDRCTPQVCFRSFFNDFGRQVVYVNHLFLLLFLVKLFNTSAFQKNIERSIASYCLRQSNAECT